MIDHEQDPSIPRSIGESSDEPRGGPSDEPRGGPRGPTSQLEPEMSYLLAYMLKNTTTWGTLATIDVGRTGGKEAWIINAQAVSALGQVETLRLSDLGLTAKAERYGVSNAFTRSADVGVDWRDVTNEAYIDTAFTFAGDYDGTGKIMAISFHTTPSGVDRAEITETDWFNPTKSNFVLGGRMVTLTPVKGSYTGHCFKATVAMKL